MVNARGARLRSAIGAPDREKKGRWKTWMDVNNTSDRDARPHQTPSAGTTVDLAGVAIELSLR